MTRLSARALKAELYSQLAAHGWRLQTLCGMPECCARDQLVTPFYVCSSVIARGGGVFHVEGAVGLIHQQFEEAWAARADRDPEEPGFGLIVLAANIDELRGYQMIDTARPLEQQTEALSRAIVQVLTEMPQNERELVAEFSDGKMFGLPVEFLSMPWFQMKCSSFKEFVEGLSASAADASHRPGPLPPSTKPLKEGSGSASVRFLSEPPLRSWNASFGTCSPIGSQLRQAFADRWVRFHCFPASKRYPDTPEEIQTALHRYDAVLGELAASIQRVALVTAGYSNSDQPTRSYPILEGLDSHAVPWRTARNSDAAEEATFWHFYVSTHAWRPASLTPLLRAVISDELANLLVVAEDSSWVFCPYPGGMDVIVASARDRDALASRHPDWLSIAVDGL